jgi:molecular chaperone GrpE
MADSQHVPPGSPDDPSATAGERRPSALPPDDHTPDDPKPVDGNVEAAPPPKDPIAEAKADVARFRENWMRTAADFDNFRKRARRELEDARKAGREDLLRDLLPVFDNLERGVQSAQQSTDVKAVTDGLGMVLKQFEGTLGKAGITRVATIGKAFDPTMHEAIQQVETNDHPPGTIVAEVQPGYMAGERLIRAAMVVVAKPKAEGTPGAN